MSMRDTKGEAGAGEGIRRRGVWVGVVGVLLLLLSIGGVVGHRVWRESRAIAMLEGRGLDPSWVPYAPGWARKWVAESDLPWYPKALVGLGAVDVGFSDDELRIMRYCGWVEYLDLDDSQVSDAGLGYVTVMDRLTTLEMSRTGVTGEGLSSIAHLTGMRTLTLNGLDVDDEDLRSLEGMKGLVMLWVGGTGVTDEGVGWIAETFEGLQMIDLSNTAVTDGAVESLLRLRELNRVRVQGSGMTREGVERLRAGKPGLDVEWP